MNKLRIICNLTSVDNVLLPIVHAQQQAPDDVFHLLSKHRWFLLLLSLQGIF